MTAVELIEEIQRLMELKGENPFKIRAFEKAATILAGREDLEMRAREGTLTELPGIGKGISEVLTEFLKTGSSKALEDLRASLPPGLLELTEIPGLGPKKAMVLIEELGIQTVAELEYACRENRLLKLKGFGEKSQDKILSGIQFRKTTQGFQRIDEAILASSMALEAMKRAAPDVRIEESGPLRRRLEVLSRLDYLVDESAKATTGNKKIEATVKKLKAEGRIQLPIELAYAPAERFGYEWVKASSSEEHWSALGKPQVFNAADEAAFYKKLSIEWISPELRETGEEVELAKKGKLGTLLSWDGIRGVFHNHTNRSDGSATLEEMVLAAKALGYEYIGISDHSQTAAYASGLRAEDLRTQEKEVRLMQEKHPEIRIFWGIESDILADGSLDYPDSVLKRFDFVVASIHSRFKMDQDAMTDRILEAIRNPYTRFLGHATGRILLGRPGYALDMKKIIAEAAIQDVAIELNAHPARLDIDWRWGGELRKRKTKIAVNPDAHATEELKNTKYGIIMARKALLPVQQVVNSHSVKDVEAWLKRK